MKALSTAALIGAVISGFLSLAIGLSITLGISFIDRIPSETRVWALQAVGWSTFFAGFFSHLSGNRLASSNQSTRAISRPDPHS